MGVEEYQVEVEANLAGVVVPRGRGRKRRASSQGGRQTKRLRVIELSEEGLGNVEKEIVGYKEISKDDGKSGEVERQRKKKRKLELYDFDEEVDERVGVLVIRRREGAKGSGRSRQASFQRVLKLVQAERRAGL